MMSINVELRQWFTNFYGEKSSGGAVKSEIMPNQQLAKELHKPIIRKFETQKVHSSFIDNI